MLRGHVIRVMRHPAAALCGAALFAIAAGLSVRGGLDAGARVAAADDPAAISDHALDHVFNRDVAEREIRAALATGDIDLALSFVELAADRAVEIDSALTEQVTQARTKAATATATAGRFVRGLWTGEPNDLASLAGTAFGDLFVFGDIRDAAREGTRYLTGQKVDPWILGLAGAGLGITAATYATAGVGLPGRIGLSLVKAARRLGRLNAKLALRFTRETIKVEEAGGVVELAENVGKVETTAGAQAAFDSLSVAENPQDMSRMARLAAAKGGKTRAIVKLLGRAAIILAASTLDLALWLLWAVFALFGFAASCKAAAERATLRYIGWRKMRSLKVAAQAA